MHLPTLTIEKATKKDLAIVIVATVVSALISYFPYRNTISIIARYWDGPGYMYVAKTLYSIPQEHPLTPYKLPAYYYSSHLPTYPLLIRGFSIIAGYEYGLIFASLAGSIFLSISFYFLIKELRIKADPVFATWLLLFLPPRILIYRNFGATEGWFLAFSVLALLLVHKKQYFFAFLIAGLASITRIFGILLILALLITVIKQVKLKAIFYALVGFGPLFLAFLLYYVKFGSFFAYFFYNSRIITSPFGLFQAYVKTSSTHSAEFYLLSMFIYGLGTFYIKKYKTLFVYSLIYFASMVFIYHLDFSRYLLGIAPFVIIIPIAEHFTTLKSKLLLLSTSPLIYLYSWGMVSGNLMPEWIYNNLMAVISR